jgi:putative phosphoesterase
MMQGIRLAVLADTHGNLPALKAVLADVQRYAVDGIIVAGDLVGGPKQVETIRLLCSLDSWMIRGNSDTSVVRYAIGEAPVSWYTDLQFALLRWDVRQLDGETLEFLRSLPEQRVVAWPGTAAIRVVHGSPRNPSESIFPGRDPTILDLALAQITEPVLVCGHTHIPWVQEQDRRLALNPGAVCGPLNGDVRAQYALLTWQGDRWQVEHQAVLYDLSQIRADFRESGLLEEGGALARSFLLSIETGQNLGEQFLSYAYRLAAEAGFENCAVVPDDVWEHAAETFDWDRAAADDR